MKRIILYILLSIFCASSNAQLALPNMSKKNNATQKHETQTVIKQSQKKVKAQQKKQSKKQNNSEKVQPKKVLEYTVTEKENTLIFNVRGVEFTMIKVDGGTFTMGGTKEQGKVAMNTRPTHRVTVSSYYLGQCEVTQELWKKIMENNPSGFVGDKHPVENVSWDDCQVFVSKLSSITEHKFRLPTEAEWEFAARGGNRSQGFKFSGSNSGLDVSWCVDNSGDVTHDVASKPCNELGFYDMSGNVFEWCIDWFGDYPYGAQTNPVGPDYGSNHVNRGGSWHSREKTCRVSSRGNGLVGLGYGNCTGLRLVLVQ